MLYQADLRDIPYSEVIEAEALRAAGEPKRESSWLYAREIVDGVSDSSTVIDELITSSSQGWALNRMPALDRALLRLATWEILYNDDVDSAVAINESIELAKEFSTDESAKFINGVLARITEYKNARS